MQTRPAIGAGLFLPTMNIDILHLHPEARTPTYATDGSGCFDLYACENATVPAGQSNAIRTGIALDLPPGWCLDIRSRSGLAFRHAVTAFHGTVDADFRGEIMVLLANGGELPYHVRPGDRIAQGRLTQAHRVTFWKAEQLALTTRGMGGFGSTGR